MNTKLDQVKASCPELNLRLPKQRRNYMPFRAKINIWLLFLVVGAFKENLQCVYCCFKQRRYRNIQKRRYPVPINPWDF